MAVLLTAGCKASPNHGPYAGLAANTGSKTTELFVPGAGSDLIDFQKSTTAESGTDATCGAELPLTDFDLGLDANLFFQACTEWIVDVGFVYPTQSAIDSVPQSGMVPSVAATWGHVYVVKTPPGDFYRVFVADDVYGVAGTVIGKKLEWSLISSAPQQLQVTPAYLTLAPCQPQDQGSCDRSFSLLVFNDIYGNLGWTGSVDANSRIALDAPLTGIARQGLPSTLTGTVHLVAPRGTYTEVVTISAPLADNSPILVPVTVSVE